MQNPFICRGKIEAPNLFWGRSEEIRDIKTRLATMQSVSIVGERRIGKSSLLYHFYIKGMGL
jgi:AAA+ ATPase superfamily predicted ATPase